MLKKLKSETNLKEIPVIMLTAESGKDNVMQIVKMGIKDYMVKPFKGEQLIERVEKIVKLESRKGEEPSEDLSNRYFSADGEIQILFLPGKVDRQVGVQVEGYLKGKIKDMVNSGKSKLIMDLSKVTQTNVSLIKLIILVIQNCQMSKIRVRVVGTPTLSSELKEFAETSEIPIYNTIEDAKADLGI